MSALCRYFLQAAEGTRTLDLLHGKQAQSQPVGRTCPCKLRPNDRFSPDGFCPGFRRVSPGFCPPIVHRESGPTEHRERLVRCGLPAYEQSAPRCCPVTGCGSGTDSDRAPADARCSSEARAWSSPSRTAAFGVEAVAPLARSSRSARPRGSSNALTRRRSNACLLPRPQMDHSELCVWAVRDLAGSGNLAVMRVPSPVRASIWRVPPTTARRFAAVVALDPKPAFRYGWILRTQLNGPKADGPLAALAFVSTVSFSHSSGNVLPCTTTWWKFGTW
jgi:hypothetical protein